MHRLLIITAVGCVAVSVAGDRGRPVVGSARGAAADADGAAPIDLQPYGNVRLKDNFHSGAEGNNLAGLPAGVRKMGGVPFRVGDKLIQLGSKVVQDKPAKVEGIKVGRRLDRLHLLHGTGYGGGPNKEGSELHVPDGTLIGRYVVRYADGTSAEVPIVYGKDVRDWWFIDDQDVTRGKVAWVGRNARADEVGARIRLYHTTWKNPSPAKIVRAIDYVATGDTAAAPFCVAITAEAK